MADGASVLPRQYRNQPGSILFAVEYAKALDVSPVTAITGIHVIDGKPTASAGLISALIRRAGHTLRVKLTGTYEGGDLAATATLIRHDDPDEPYSSTWTLERACRANLVTLKDGRYAAVKSGSAWDTYPESMLKARAVTEVGRDAAEDVLLGVHYTAEELGAEIDSSGDPVYTVTQVPDRGPAPRTDPDPRPTPSQQGDGEVVEATVVEEPVDPGVAVREAILAATSLEELTAVWKAAPISATTANANAIDVVDDDGVVETATILFKRASDAIKEGTTLSGIALDVEPVEPVVESDANLVDLERLLVRLEQENPTAMRDVVTWAADTGRDLATRDNVEAGSIVEAIAAGETFLSRTVLETFDENPAALVARLLGAVVIEETPNSQQQQHEHELDERARLAREEDRREAAEARAAGGKPLTPDAAASIKAARDAARAAAATD